MTTKAEEAFNALSVEEKAEIANAVFNILEYDAYGNAGSEWDSDTLQALGEMFHFAGITFTPPTTT